MYKKTDRNICRSPTLDEYHVKRKMVIKLSFKYSHFYLLPRNFIKFLFVKTVIGYSASLESIKDYYSIYTRETIKCIRISTLDEIPPIFHDWPR